MRYDVPVRMMRCLGSTESESKQTEEDYQGHSLNHSFGHFHCTVHFMLNNDKTVQYRILYVLSVNHSVQLKEAAHDELMKGSLTVGHHLRAMTGEITPGAVHM